jgi:uncharacterized protein (TIRG00374 family)
MAMSSKLYWLSPSASIISTWFQRGYLLFKSLRFWIGIAVSAIFLAFFFSFFVGSFGKMADAFKSANYVYIIPAVALYFIAVWFRTLRWRFLLTPLGSFSLRRLYPVVVVGYMANNLLPARLGELVRAYYIREREEVSAAASLATILLERVYDGLALLLFIAIVFIFLPMTGVSGLGSEDAPLVLRSVPAILTALAFIVILGFLTLFALNPRAGEAIARWIARLAPGRLRPRVQELVELFIGGLSALRSPRRQLGVLFLSLPVWLFEGGMYLMVGISFGLDGLMSGMVFVLSVMFLVTAAANLALTLPSSPGGVGPFELLAAASLVLVGVEKDLASSYALALHVVLLVPVTLLGLFFWWRQSFSLSQITGGGKVGEEATTQRRETL